VLIFKQVAFATLLVAVLFHVGGLFLVIGCRLVRGTFFLLFRNFPFVLHNDFTQTEYRTDESSYTTQTIKYNVCPICFR
jgi:hypothetical protein